MRYKSFILVLSVIIILSGVVNSQTDSTQTTQPVKPTILDGIAAVINDQIILHSEVLLYVTQVIRAEKINPALEPEKFKEVYDNVLNSLVDSKVEVAKAMEDTLIVVTDEELEQAVNNRMMDIERQADAANMTLEQFAGGQREKLTIFITGQMRDELYKTKLRQSRSSEIAVSRSEIERFYQTYKDSIPEIPATYDLSHILKLPEPDEAIGNLIRAKMDSLHQLIINGADFAELARLHSEDTGSSLNGGDIGWTGKGDMYPEFEQTAFNLKKGETSEVIQTMLGFHIIQSMDDPGEKYHPRHILMFHQITKADEDRTVEFLKTLRQRALGGEDFGELSVEYSNDEDVKDNKGYLGVFPRQSLDPNFAQAVNTAIAGKNTGDITEPFQTDFGYHIILINSYREARKYTLVEDYEEIKQMALNQKYEFEYQQWFNEAKKDIYIVINNPFANDSTSTIK